tara:strand:+ start:72278 stop:72397 length:120 start_codon:yes stop_codon:yes gene_type:complete
VRGHSGSFFEDKKAPKGQSDTEIEPLAFLWIGFSILGAV